MADIQSTGGGHKYTPLVPATTDMPEFTAKALAIGLVMCVVLGAANAYLGLSCAALGQYDVILARSEAAGPSLRAASAAALHFLSFYLPRFLP